MASKVKFLKDGRYKLSLDADLRAVLGQAMAAALHFEGEEMEDYLFALLSETLRAIETQDTPRLPRSAVLAAQPPALREECLLAGGDDYELLFCAPAAHHDAVLAAGQWAGVPVQRIGHILERPGLSVVNAAGQAVALQGLQAFDHFKS